ncbi:DUF5700 domain-containing putative Zn-dependent protease [Mucilaginibacter sp. OK098]|uniref:DUF5700 domain-containing putative Zn-dependent protease n=1 Tax=Mucilaginibacter sp. OK098 TaxID=1855297 RepID=UPI00091287FC|nr:DUF5700 domain-containing putative Zn-dependent protease [Mucilaginibacter sp. OK098]SHM58230.1 hypothetical protein SAMN05216524_102590 [Mucilaginibacter sp. OK098]
MKTTYKLFCFAIAAIFTIDQSAHAQTINTEAVTKYWELTDSLKHNKPITDAQWGRFINIEGNKTYALSEFDSVRLIRYRKAIEIAYLPTNDSMLQARLTAKDWYCILAKRYKDEEVQLKAYLANITEKPDYFNQAYQYVYEYLPKRSQHRLKDIKLYYNCLSNDAISYPNGLFFSLLSVIDNSKTKTGTLEAHELHHRLREETDISKNQDPKDAGLLWAIHNIPNEGIADMIDKTWEKPEDIKEWLIDPAPATIKSLDSCIMVLALNKDNIQTERYYRNLLKRTTGHMPGFYMAQIIVKNGYKQQMVDRSDDPFVFFYLYNKAAEKDAAHPPIFSAKSIAYLGLLERRCKK